jgi:hypothetical protein
VRSAGLSSLSRSWDGTLLSTDWLELATFCSGEQIREHDSYELFQCFYILPTLTGVTVAVNQN